MNIKRNTVATYETGKSNPSDAAVNLICREFRVNEAWLRTGSGEMFQEMSRDDEIAAFFGDVLRDESDDFRKRFIAMLSKLDASDWAELERMAVKLAGGGGVLYDPPSWARPDQKEPPAPVDQHAIWEAEAQAEAEQVYREVLAEKKAAAASSASPFGSTSGPKGA